MLIIITLVLVIGIVLFFKCLNLKNVQNKPTLIVKPKLDPIKQLSQFRYIEYAHPSTEKFHFSILSYNILGQKFMKRKNIPSLSQEKRIQKIIFEIQLTFPDIFCLQESTSEVFYQYLQQSLSLIYIMITLKNEDSYLMNVIGIKKDRFDIINEIKFDMKALDVNVVGNRGIIGAQVNDKRKNININIFNVHFPWKPEYEYEKAFIFQHLLDYIKEKKLNNVIIAGDFNSLPNSIVIRMVYYPQFINEINDNEEYIGSFCFNDKEERLIKELRRKMKKKSNFKEKMSKLLETSRLIYEQLCLRSAYENYQNNTLYKETKYSFLRNHPKYTNYTKNFKDTIDYILYSKHFKKIRIGTFPSLHEKEDYLPNEIFPSDHLKLFCQFELIA